MVRLKSAAEIKILRQAGKRLAWILDDLVKQVKPGVNGLDLEKLARRLLAEERDEPSFLNYQPPGEKKPYPAALCVSVNNEVVHGLPTARPFQSGDLVSLDLGLKRRGLFVDMAVTVSVPPFSVAAARLLNGTKEALARAIKAVRPGVKLGDIGAVIENTAQEFRLGLVRDLGGHGVGHAVHEEPMVPNFGPAGQGLGLKAGMVLAIEPMFTLGDGQVKFSANDFVVKTADHTLAAHFEHTILVSEKEAEVLTQQ